MTGVPSARRARCTCAIEAAASGRSSHQHHGSDRHGQLDINRWRWQFSGTQALDEAYVPFLGAFGAAWDDGMVARWSANPLGMLWPERDAAFVTSGGNGGPPATARRPMVVIAAG